MAPRSLSPSSVFGSTTSPYTTAPSSPSLLGYFSDDVSPESEIELLDSVCSFVPFNWEEKPGKPKSYRVAGTGEENDDSYADIAFEFCVDRLESLSLPAEDLFDGGKIKPLKPPPRLQLESAGITDSPEPTSGRKSLSHSSRRTIIAWSSRWNYNFIDPFEAAIESARKGDGVFEFEIDETASFAGSSRFKRLKNLLPFRRISSEGDNGGFGSTGRSGSGSGSSSASGSVNEPDNGYEEGGRRLPLCRPHFFSCFMGSL